MTRTFLRSHHKEVEITPIFSTLGKPGNEQTVPNQDDVDDEHNFCRVLCEELFEVGINTSA